MELPNLITTRSDSDSIPWFSEYELPKGKKVISAPVLAIFKTNKGLLVCTAEFKYFLWKNSKDYNNLEEALKVYIANLDNAYLLLATPAGKTVKLSKGEKLKGSGYFISEAMEGYYIVPDGFNQWQGNNLL